MGQDEGPAAEVVNPEGAGAIVIACDHASSFIPAGMGELGLAPADRLSHAVHDIGALPLATRLARAFDAPLVASRVSRLVHDCNRPPGHASAMPARVETIEIPGNAAIGGAEACARAQAVYEPYHALLAATLEGRARPPTLITLHSFSPTWFGQERKVELGILHDADDRLAKVMLRAARARSTLRAALNEPYSAADGVTHTLARHAIPKGLANVMIEIRNDLIADGRGVDRVAVELVEVIEAALQELRIKTDMRA